MRYTEARMTAPAMELLADLELRHRRLPAQLRRDARMEPTVLPEQVPEPAGQRLDRHRRRHGVQPAAAQPARDLRRDRPRDRQPGLSARTSCWRSSRARISRPAGSSAAATASSKATRPAAGASRCARRSASKSSKNGRTQRSSSTRSLRHHPQDDRRIDRRRGEERPDQGHQRRQRPLRPRAQVPDRGRPEARRRPAAS